MKWQNKITKKEMNHLRENGTPGNAPTLWAFQRQREVQLRHKAESEKHHPNQPGITEPCWDCKRIAHKLGMN